MFTTFPSGPADHVSTLIITLFYFSFGVGFINYRYGIIRITPALRQTDTGIGIPVDKAEWVFERFTKIDLFIPGSGLGLSISRLIATCLGGKIYVDTTYTKGCRIKIELPIQPKA